MPPGCLLFPVAPHLHSCPRLVLVELLGYLSDHGHVLGQEELVPQVVTEAQRKSNNFPKPVGPVLGSLIKTKWSCIYLWPG